MFKKSLLFALAACLIACGGEPEAVTPPPPDVSQLAFASAPASTYQGEPLSPITVEVRDEAGAVKSGITGTVTLALGEGALAGTTSAELSGGKATFSGLHVDTAVSGAKLVAHLAGLTDATSSAFDVKPVQVKLSAPPSGLVSGDTFSLTATLADAQTGETLALARPVTLAASGLAVSGEATQTTAAGVATFAGLSAPVGGQGALSASAPAAQGSDPVALQVTQLSLEFQNLISLTLPGPLPDFQVRLVDPNGNLLANTQRAITLTGSGATVSGNLSATAQGGVATFTGLAVDQAASFTFTASAAGANDATSATVSTRFSTGEAELADKSTQTNDTVATAEPITPGVPVFGSLATAGDVDFYGFHARADQLLDLASFAGRMDQASFTAGIEVALYAADGTRLHLNNATVMYWSPSDYGFTDVRIPAEGDYFVSIAVEGGGAGGKYALRLDLSPVQTIQSEAEPVDTLGSNDAVASAEAIVAGWVSGQQYYDAISSTGDQDFFKIHIDQPTRIRAQIYGHRNGLSGAQTSAYDAEIFLYDGASTQLFNNDDSYFFDSSFDYLITTPGDYFVDVQRCCDTGTVPYVLSYGAEPVTFTPEVLPNDTAASATPVAYGDMVSGTSTATEAHFFSFTGKAGDRVRIRPYGSGLNDVSVVSIHSYIFQADGTTPITELANNQNFSLTQAILPADGEYRVRITGDTAGSWAFLLERLAQHAYEVEPNSAPITAGGTVEANPFSPSGRAAGTIGTAGDEDNFSFQAKAGQLVSIDLYGMDGNNNAAYNFSEYGSKILPQLQIVDGNGTVLASSVYTGSPSIFAESQERPAAALAVAFEAPADGTYYLVVTDTAGAGGADHPYALELFHDR